MVCGFVSGICVPRVPAAKDTGSGLDTGCGRGRRCVHRGRTPVVRRRRPAAVVRARLGGDADARYESYVDLDVFFSVTSEVQTAAVEGEATVFTPSSAAVPLSDRSSSSPPPPPTPKKKPIRVQVITDIDDTVKSSGGKKLAGQYLGGVDTQYRRGECYPGVFQFALELATHGLPAAVEPLPMAVLTARAREFKFALALEENHPICRKYRYMGMERGYEDWGIGPVLYGSVKEWVFQERKGLRKFRNFQLLQHYNNRTCGEDGAQCETKYVYVGDTGELDHAAGKMMLKRYSDSMKAVFLHVVYDATRESDVDAEREDSNVKGVPILFFRTYVGAARKAAEHGLMDEKALRRVAARALKDLLRIEPDHGSSKWIDLMRDIKDADLVPGKHWLWT